MAVFGGGDPQPGEIAQSDRPQDTVDGAKVELSALYVGGAGQISSPCVEASLGAVHAVTILN
jgi:hypothetical protein